VRPYVAFAALCLGFVLAPGAAPAATLAGETPSGMATLGPQPPGSGSSAPHSLRSQLKVCNNFKTEVYFAFASRRNGDWTSSGWLRVPTNACKVTHPANAYRAEATLSRYANGTMLSESWGTGRKLCVKNDAFVFHHAEAPCSGARREQFNIHDKSIIVAITMKADGEVDLLTMQE
jgi:uncharacterized membrane protein